MRTLTELRAFCEGYRLAAMANLPNKDLSDLDEWFRWGGFDLNLYGSYWGIRAEGQPQTLCVEAYPEDWADVLPAPIHSFDITGETNE